MARMKSPRGNPRPVTPAPKPGLKLPSVKLPGLKRPVKPGAGQAASGTAGTAGKAGSARPGASKPVKSRVPVALPEESAPGHWLRSIRLSGFTFVMLALLVLMIVVLAPSLRTLVDQQQQLAELRASVAQHEASVDELESDIARWDDPAFIEAQARDRLVYVFPGDYTYLVIDDTTTVTTDDGAPISDDIQTTKVDWVHSLLSSLVTAGTTTKTVEQLEAPAQQ